MSAGLDGQAGVAEQDILKILAAYGKLLRPKTENVRRSLRVTHHPLDFRAVPSLQSFERQLAQNRISGSREKHQDFDSIFRWQRQVTRRIISKDPFRYLPGTN